MALGAALGRQLHAAHRAPGGSHHGSEGISGPEQVLHAGHFG